MEIRNPEEFARFLADLIAGRRFTPSESSAFEAERLSRAYTIPVTNATRRALGSNPRRTKLVIQNLSASDIEFGNDSLVWGQGIRVAAGATYFDDVATFTGEIFLVANVVGPLDIRVREES